MHNYDTGDKRQIKPSAFLNPVPVIMATCGSMDKSNIITLAWAGTVNSEPPMLSVSVRKERYSYSLIKDSGLFGVNLVSKQLVRQCDYCGVKSGRDIDKFADTGLTKIKGPITGVPLIAESPVSLECRVIKMLELGSHDMFIGAIENVLVSDKLFDVNGAINLAEADLIAYNHGEYYALGEFLGFFGYSVAGKEALQRRMKKQTK